MVARRCGLGFPLALCFMLLGAGIAAARASAQIVRGSVVETGDGSPISGARLIFRDIQGAVRASAVSGADGRFALRTDGAAYGRIEVAHLAYAAWWTVDFALGTEDDLEIEVRLGIEAIPLEALTVVASAVATPGRMAGFEQRRSALGGFGGYYLTADEIERRPVATSSTLVLGTPGMTLGRATGGAGLERTVILTRNCLAQTFIDGVRVTQLAGGSIDDLLPPDRIAGIEMYPRGLSAPPQYQDARNPECGVVLFWTKDRPGGTGRGSSFGRMAIGLGLLGAIITLAIIG